MREDVQVLDLPGVFERVCVEMGATYRSMHGWTHEEVEATVDLMCKEFKGTVDSFEEYVRNDDAEGLMALAEQESTKRLLKAVIHQSIGDSCFNDHRQLPGLMRSPQA